MAIRDSRFGIASRCRFNASQLQLHNFNPLNEILHCFQPQVCSLSNLYSRFKRFGPNAGADTQAPLNEPLEKYNNPPAPPRKIETSPRMVSPFGVFISYQANVDQMATTSSEMLRTSPLFLLIPQTATR